MSASVTRLLQAPRTAGTASTMSISEASTSVRRRDSNGGDAVRVGAICAQELQVGGRPTTTALRPEEGRARRWRANGRDGRESRRVGGRCRLRGSELAVSAVEHVEVVFVKGHGRVCRGFALGGLRAVHAEEERALF